MMDLPILSASVVDGDADAASRVVATATTLCRGCRAPVGRHAFGVAGKGQPADCALCWLARHLERPKIDDEARVIWLPGMSQAALNATVRVIHLRRRAASLGLPRDGNRRRPEEHDLHFAEAGLQACAEAARARAGSDRPSDLARALLRLQPETYRRRGSLLGGLRLLPLGRFFDGEADIYPDIVDGWRAAQSAAETA
jgi:intracellular multiplication protein IcmJ